MKLIVEHRTRLHRPLRIEGEDKSITVSKKLLGSLYKTFFIYEWHDQASRLAANAPRPVRLGQWAFHL